MNAHSVRTYIPPPLQCYVCQRYGHGSKVCESEARCVHCSQTGHDQKLCPNRDKTPCCANCGGEHPACANKCPARQVNKEILKFKTNNNTTYQQARSTILPKGTSYAAALKKVKFGHANDHPRSNQTGRQYEQQTIAPSCYPQNAEQNRTTCNCKHNNNIITEDRLKAVISLLLNIFTTILPQEKALLIKEGMENIFSPPSGSRMSPDNMHPDNE